MLEAFEGLVHRRGTLIVLLRLQTARIGREGLAVLQGCCHCSIFRGVQREKVASSSVGPGSAHSPPRACAANADRSLTDGKPILRENWVLLSHPPSSPGRPSCGQGRGPRGPRGPVCWPCSHSPPRPPRARPESAPRSGPSQAQPGQAHSQGQGPGVQTRRVTAAGARRPGVVGAWARARRTGGPLLPQAGWRLSLGPSLCYSKGAPLGRGIPQSGFKFSLSALGGCEHVTSPLGNSAPSISKWK